MQISVTRTLFAAVLFGGMAFILPTTRGLGQQPGLPEIPAAPTVTSPVLPPGPFIRTPALAQPGDKDKKNGEKPGLPPLIETGPELSLSECIAVAIERSPRLKAVQASIAATEAGYKALTNFGTVGTWFSPDLDIRKQQAQRGLAAAAGEYQKEYNEVVQDVTRLYYTVVYAQQQEVLVTRVVEDIAELVQIVKELLDSKVPPDQLGGLNTGKLRVMQIGLAEARVLQLTAQQGRKQAMAALRQVMAVDEQGFAFRVKDAELPLMKQEVPINKQLVVDLAVSRRPELSLAAAGVDAFRLEVYAQAKIPCKRVVPTLASGADIHAKEIPQAMRGKDYRPGGIIPEMPTQLVGNKFDRVCRAMAFSQKADAMYESVRSLIVLEAENAFFEFELAAEKVRIEKDKLTAGLDLQRITRAGAADQKAKDVLVQAYVAAAKAQSDYITAVYQHVLALAALERVTAGGIRPAFPSR